MASDLSNPIGFENTPAEQNGTESISVDSTYSGQPAKQGLYSPSNERDACGVGFVAHIKGKKSHDIVQKGLELLTNLTHRGATGYDPKLGDGAGLLMQMPDAFMRKEAAKLNINLPAAGQYAVATCFCRKLQKTVRHVKQYLPKLSRKKIRHC